VPVPDHIRARREAERAGRGRAARRRGVALLALVVLLGAAAAAVVAGAFGGGSGGGGAQATAGRTAPATERPATGTGTATGRASAPAPATGSYRGRVPILMYHVIRAPAADAAYPELWTPKATFRATIAALGRAGYRGVTMRQVLAAWRGGPGLPDRPVVVSFDDGYTSHYAAAMPILREVGWPGVLYLAGKNLGLDGGLSRRQARALLAAGWEIGGHSMTHPDLPDVGDAQLREEVAGVRRLLERELGTHVTDFAYPSGKWDERVRAAVRDAGYRSATTVEPGIAGPRQDRFALPRVRVNGSDSAGDVLARLRASR
jgi:peptidoglycan/xylan/chitin deacetylase (PgdA/CDA1 family)